MQSAMRLMAVVVLAAAALPLAPAPAARAPVHDQCRINQPALSLIPDQPSHPFNIPPLIRVRVFTRPCPLLCKQ